MAERLSLSPSALRQTAERCASLAGELDSSSRRLTEGLAALGDVCGGDEAGTAFAAEHDAARSRVEAAVANLIRCTQGMADGLLAAAASFEEAEAASTIPARAS